MLNLADPVQRRTSADVVFHQLYDEIGSLDILPGTKLSETDIAQRFGVSRQPVRDAFNRLENLGLLRIRPQRATEVRGFSLEQVAHSRFVRLAVELEVVRRACSIWDTERAEALDENLQLQSEALIKKQTDQFHMLDYQFHKMICELGGCPRAFVTIQESKKEVERLCVLSLDRSEETKTLFDDHVQLAEALKTGATEKATTTTRLHLSRLDNIITEIHLNHSEYFE